ncbi:hypothetical protein KCG48_12980 [Proteiniclasticum sp. BAD-10]|uniref:ABC-three component systems C-terminal domain-containing protein n=1 Tax=Proteiniclasticum sediminis TaxID=2804028 RepID=A0A941CR43_9CLOT|nr:ABC-three component system protein [Proteiniclasticum sediminis]MBR0577230.1 hypothetical protein [Proteiniclasticum sediminis]
MTFSELANLLYPYCGQGQKNSDFVVSLIDNIMENASDDEGYNEYNPLVSLVPRNLENYFSGGRPISQKNASIILGLLDKSKFVDYLELLPTDALSGIAMALNDNGIFVSDLDVPQRCADLLEQVLKECSRKKADRAKFRSSTETSEELIPTQAKVTPVRRFKPLVQLSPPDEVEIQEIPYITELLAAYGDAENMVGFDREDLASYPGYTDNFNRHRKDFFSAESVRRGIREAYGDADPDQFEVLKDETFDGIIDVWEQDFAHGFRRLGEVMIQASKIRIDRCWLVRDTDWIGNSQKKGVCHILVNDGRIKGWVKNGR